VGEPRPSKAVVQELAPAGQGNGGAPELKLVPGRMNEPNWLRIRSEQEEDMFVLYFVDAAKAFVL
jgi:hypothetical protein